MAQRCRNLQEACEMERRDGRVGYDQRKLYICVSYYIKT